MSLPYPVPEPMRLHTTADDERSTEKKPEGYIILQDLPEAPYRYFIIKSNREDVLIGSVNTGEWFTTNDAANVLNQAIGEFQGKGNLMLFFSVVASGGFCGVAEIAGQSYDAAYSRNSVTTRHPQCYSINWLIIRDIPNPIFQDISVGGSEFQSVIKANNCTEIDQSAGGRMYTIFENYPHRSSMLQRARGIVNFK